MKRPIGSSRKTLLLTLMALAIWVWLGMKLKPREAPLSMVSSNRSQTKLDSSSFMNCYELLLNYEDPFAIKPRAPIEQVSQAKPKRKVIEQTEKKQIVTWPKIELIGLVLHDKSERSMAILKVDENELSLGIDDSYRGLRIKQIETRAVLISLDEEERKFEL